MKMMTNQTAHYLRTLFDLGSISRAADALGISQPSLTQYIQRIENEWKVEIIDRSIRPFRPTEEGLMILKTEQAVAELRNNCHQALIDFAQGVRGHIRIGVSEYREIFFLTDVLPIFKKRYPLVEISLIEGTTDQLETFARDGLTDISITIAPTYLDNFLVDELFLEKHLLAVPSNSPILKGFKPKKTADGLPIFPFERLNNQPFLIVKSGQRLHDVFLELCKTTSAKPKVVLESESLAASLALANAGLGATIVTDYLAERFDNANCHLRYFELAPAIAPRSVIAIRRRSRYVPKAVSALIDTMKEVATNRK